VNYEKYSSFQVDKELHGEFKATCARLRRNMGAEIERLVIAYIANPPEEKDSHISIFEERPKELLSTKLRDRPKELVG